jgi:hypothetical protein
MNGAVKNEGAATVQPITHPELIGLGERIHEIVLHFKQLRASSFWRIETFRVRDVATDLDRKQAIWLGSWIALHLRIKTEEEVMKLPIELADDLRASDGEMYTIQIVPDWARQDKDASVSAIPSVKLLTARLEFTTVKRHQGAAA